MLHPREPAVFPGGSARSLARGQHRHQPPGADRHPRHRGLLVRIPVRGEGRGLREQDAFLPGDQGAAQPEEPRGLDHPEAALPGNLGLPSLPPCVCHRRNQRRGLHEDPQARLGEVSGRAADQRQRARPGLPGPRVGGQDHGNRQEERHRGPVRRQVLRARRPGDPPGAARGELPGRHGRVVQRGPEHQGQDHQGRHLPREARDKPGPVHPGGPAGAEGRHDRPDQPEPPDG